MVSFEGFGAVDVTVEVSEVDDVVVVLDSDESPEVVTTACEVDVEFSKTVKFEKEGVVLGKAGVVIDMVVVVIVLVDVDDVSDGVDDDVADGVDDIFCGVVVAADGCEVKGGVDDDVFMLESILVDASLTVVTQDNVDDVDRDENDVVAAADVYSRVATVVVISVFVVSFFVVSSTIGGVDDAADVFGDVLTIIFIVVVVVALFVDVNGCPVVISVVVLVELDFTVLVVLVVDVGADVVGDVK